MAKISDGEKKRLSLFKRYANNLNILKGSGLLGNFNIKYPETYVCPICLEQFPEHGVKNSYPNHLTLEDVPPKSLKGKPIILTCRSCNNTTGGTIDYHLLHRMLEVDKYDFLPNSENFGKIVMGEEVVPGTVSVDEKGVIRVKVKEKITTKSITIQFPIKSDTNKLQLALLKIGYLMTFTKFGYAFILDKCYDRVRQQLLNPTTLIYPTDFWFEGPFPREQFGVPFITEKNMEAAFPLFPLITKSSERIFGTIIPLTNKQIEEVIAEVKGRFSKSKTFEVEMYGFNGPTDYLSDVDAIKHLLNWIEKRRNKK